MLQDVEREEASLSKGVSNRQAEAEDRRSLRGRAKSVHLDTKHQSLYEDPLMAKQGHTENGK